VEALGAVELVAELTGTDAWLAETEVETEDEVEAGGVEGDDETGVLIEVETVVLTSAAVLDA